MCGICGIVNRSDKPVERTTIDSMSRLLRHRGEDGEGVFMDGCAGFAHRRLSIIDIKNGGQPVFSDNKRLCLVYNGEIYNFKNLRAELKRSGHSFKTASDSEVLLRSYEQWGEDCLEKLRGMFAFAIWDRVERKLFIARDRIGIKPLYYLELEDQFAFASEAKALLPLLGHAVSVNEPALRQFLRFSFIPENDQTMFAGIKKLPPAHCISVDRSGRYLKRYWKLEKKREYAAASFPEAKDEFTAMLRESVRMELVSDVPVGVMLSGGIDSSAISALARGASERVAAITASFDSRFDESAHAALVASHLGIRHLEFKVDTAAVMERLPEMVWYMDGLTTADGGFFSTYLLSEKIREAGIKAVLLGEGSDEILGGYRRFGIARLPFQPITRRFAGAAYYYSLTKELPKDSVFWDFLRKFANCAEEDAFHRISSFEINWQLPNHLLKKVDSATMAQSIEARVPFLDHRLVEFAYSIPDEFKFRKEWGHSPPEKLILRESMKGLLPDAVIKRKKMGFLLPIEELLEGNELVRDLLFEERGAARAYFSRKEMVRLLKKGCGFYEKKRTALLWRLFILSAWYKRYFLEPVAYENCPRRDRAYSKG